LFAAAAEFTNPRDQQRSRERITRNGKAKSRKNKQNEADREKRAGKQREGGEGSKAARQSTSITLIPVSVACLSDYSLSVFV
jgi:hypothetical protein